MTKIGDKLTASLKTTSGRNYTVSVAGMTADVDTKGNMGSPVRVPCVLATDRLGREHLLVLVDWSGGKRWLGSSHRTILMLREVETQYGEMVSGALKDRVDAALEAAEQ